MSSLDVNLTADSFKCHSGSVLKDSFRMYGQKCFINDSNIVTFVTVILLWTECNTNLCPAEISCELGFELKTTTGVCCKSYECGMRFFLNCIVTINIVTIQVFLSRFFFFTVLQITKENKIFLNVDKFILLVELI